MTKKEMQLNTNQVVSIARNKLVDFIEVYPLHRYTVKRLRTCNAKVYECDKYYILVSYSTIVAYIDRKTMLGYDFLRFVYGYTSTSAQHISKFFHDYGVYASYTWKEV